MLQRLTGCVDVPAQIKMISDPAQIGGRQRQALTPAGGPGAAAAVGVAGSVLDMFGCGANYRRH